MAVGCGSHTAQIVDRSGALVAEAHVLTSVEWSRVLDDTSTATVEIEPDGDCCARLDEVRSWRHELAIWRDGQPVWSGPIINVEWGVGRVEIVAGDVLAWLDRRVPHEDMTFGAADLTDIASWLIEDAFRPDDPGHRVQVVAPSRVRGDRAYEIDLGQTGDHLRDLAETGLDYTAVGSTILLLPEDHIESVGALTDADLPEGLVVVEDGAELTTRWVVHGKEDEDGEPVVGAAGGQHSYYGLLERSIEETSILDEFSAGAAARSRLRASLPVPLWLDSQEVTISPDAAVDVPSLVPGWCLDVTSSQTCRGIAQRMKIAGITVSEDGEGESVQVQLAPSGAGEVA